jgi:predicted amidohydrolase YtcJ
MRTLITNANVLVMDGVTAPQQAIVVDGTRILGSGSAADMKRLAGAGCRSVDAGGATVMPGIVDTHPHILHFAAQKARWWTSPMPRTTTTSSRASVRAPRSRRRGSGS